MINFSFEEFNSNKLNDVAHGAYPKKQNQVQDQGHTIDPCQKKPETNVKNKLVKNRTMLRENIVMQAHRGTAHIPYECHNHPHKEKENLPLD